MSRKITLVLCIVGLISIGTAQARPDKSWKSWFGHIETGYIYSQGDYGDVVDDDWILSGGAMYQPDDWAIGIDLTLAYSEQDVSQAALDFINDQIGMDPMNDGEITGGDVEIWSLVTSAVWSTKGDGPVGFNVSAGVGVYALDARLTNTGLVYYPPVCDPYWYWCIPGGIGPGTVVRASESTTEFGWNVGIGLTFELSSGSELFLEAKYHSVETDRTTEYVPLTFGYRW